MTELSDVEALAEVRTRSRQYRHHLEFLADTYVDQALVKAALLAGLSQTEVAKVLGMSKKTVNTHSRRPWHPYAVASGTGLLEADESFYRHVWGSAAAAADAIATCKRYDRDRLDLVSSLDDH